MFGYIRINPAALTEEEQARYRSFYCGLCQALGERHGAAARMALTFDLTFLTVFLSSLYEPEETRSEGRCLPHPVKRRERIRTRITDYAADMTIALTYHKCRDDWADDRKLPAKAFAALLKRRYEAVKAAWPRQCGAIETALEELAAIERRRDPLPDAAPNAFGRLMAELFVMEEDFWAGALRAFGRSLGRYIEMLDAVCDTEKDARSGAYNPVLLMGRQPEDMQDTLQMLLGDASAAFEALPLVQDEELLRNILYSGLWAGYNDCLQKRAKSGEKRCGKSTCPRTGKEGTSHGE